MNVNMTTSDEISHLLTPRISKSAQEFDDGVCEHHGINKYNDTARVPSMVVVKGKRGGSGLEYLF